MNIKAKPIVDGKFWIVEENGEKIGVLHKKENNKFMLSSKGTEKYFSKKDELTKLFGKEFFETKIKSTVSTTSIKEKQQDISTVSHPIPSNSTYINPSSIGNKSSIF